MIKKMRERLKNQKGMTLIELLAVIVILGIIAAIAIPSIGNIIQNSREDAVKADAISILNAAKLYVASNGEEEDGTTTMTKAAKGDGPLDEFIDSGTSLDEVGYTVEYDGTTYTISSNSVPAGKKHITFTDATVDDINKENKTKVDID